MLKPVHWKRFKIVRESWESQRAGGRCNPASVLLLGPKGPGRVRCVLGCGSSDDVDIYSDRAAGVVVVVSVNRSLPYCGIEVFAADSKLHGSDALGYELNGPGIFLQGSEQVEESLGRKGVDLHPRTIARRLYDLYHEVNL